jgi:hypothetical protein
MDLIATNYLTGGLLTLLLPVGLLIAVLIYWAVVLRRSHGGGA